MSVDEYVLNHPAYQYAQDITSGKLISNWEIKKVCQNFLDELEDNDCPYFFDVNLLKKITGLFHYIQMGRGDAQGKTVDESLAPFQWFFICNILCFKYKNDPEKRQYERGVMLIARKNGKTFLVALIFILLLFVEPKFSTFYSVAPDLDLSSTIKTEIETIIEMSPAISKYFKRTNKEIRCTITGSSFTPLATSNDRMDSRLAQVWMSDETGALKTSYPIDAMASSQIGIKNKTGIIISTAYQTLHNPMTEEIDRDEQILHGTVKDDSIFSMIYKPDNEREWQDNDEELLKANPLGQFNEQVGESIKKKREEAILMPSKRANFLTKHMNVFVEGDPGESFVSEEELDNSELQNDFDWKGRDVNLGLDLAFSNDNCAVAMSTYDEVRDIFVAKVWAFYPKDKEKEKTRIEHVPYAQYNTQDIAYACGGQTISYEFIEKFIENIPNKYGVNIKKIGYDAWNARSTVNKLDNDGFDMYEVKQRASGLYPGTKLLREKIENNEFFFEPNELLKTNFRNAVMVYDSQMSYFLNKKKSNGKIDMCAALVNTMCLWADEIDNESNKITGDSVFAL